MQSQGDLSHLTTASGDAQETIMLTVWGDQVLVKSAQDVGAMPFTEFATIYAVSVQHVLNKMFYGKGLLVKHRSSLCM